MQANEGIRCRKARSGDEANRCDATCKGMTDTFNCWEHYSDNAFPGVHLSVPSPTCSSPTDNARAVANENMVFATEPHVRPDRHWGLPKIQSDAVFARADHHTEPHERPGPPARHWGFLPDTESHVRPGATARHWDFLNDTEPHVRPGPFARRWGFPKCDYENPASSDLHMSCPESYCVPSHSRCK